VAARRPGEPLREVAWQALSCFPGYAAKEALMQLLSCIPVIPSADLEKSLRFWVEGLGFATDRAMRQDSRLVGCMVHNERLSFWLNQRAGSPIKPENYESIRLYWAPVSSTS